MTQALTSPGGGSLAIAGGRNSALAPHGSEPPGASPDTPFCTVLDDHQARTAVAEGHQQKRQDAADRDDAGDAPADPASREASALAALLGGVPLPAGVKLTAVAMAATQQTDTSAGARAPAALPSGAAGLPTAADAPALPMPTGPSVPAAATALPLRPPVPAEGASAAAGTTAEQPIPAAPAATTAAARATRLADVLQSATARPTALGSDAAPTSAAAPVPPAATVAGAAASRSFDRAPDQGAANGAAPQPTAPAPVQPTATAPTQGGMPVAATAPTPGVGLDHAVETVRLALRAAADRGVTHARISLTPRELGSIEVHLRQTADGLVARVVAEHATAAQLLHNAGGELRRQLESQGLTLLRLDIGASGEQSGRPGDRALANGGGAFGESAGGSRSRDGEADPLAPLDGATDQASTTTTTLALPNGALVDVLA